MSSEVSAKLTSHDLVDLFLLSALWGGSFLFLRIAAPVFGPIFLIEMRVLTAFIFLFPVFLYFGRLQEALRHWKIICLISVANMALPFCLLAFASLSIGAGFASILNATVPFFTAIVAFLFYQQRMTRAAVAGLFLGFGGVLILVADPESVNPARNNMLAISAGLLAAISYAIAANVTATHLRGISGLAITVGSLFCASVYLLPLAVWQRPDVIPTGRIWFSVIALGVLSTGLAYLLFYRLITRIGSYRAVTVTFLVPMFSIAWGFLFLGEAVTVFILLGCIFVLLGVGMTTGKLTSAWFGTRRAQTPDIEP